jgi:hypothetical protein
MIMLAVILSSRSVSKNLQIRVYKANLSVVLCGCETWDWGCLRTGC